MIRCAFRSPLSAESRYRVGALVAMSSSLSGPVRFCRRDRHGGAGCAAAPRLGCGFAQATARAKLRAVGAEPACSASTSGTSERLQSAAVGPKNVSPVI
jgi:hypothetical protein